MLPIIKQYLKAIILILFLLLDIIFANVVLSGQYDKLYNDLYNDSKSYINQNKINEMKNIVPQYDENKANYKDAGDQASAQQFLNYATELTGSCTVSMKKETKKAVCEERVEYTYKPVDVTQNKIIDGITYSEKTIMEYVTKYYCDITDKTYDTQTQCQNDCEDEQEANITYNCNSGTYNSSTGRCEASLETETIESCPAGFSRSGNLCIANIDVDCSPGSFNSTTDRCEMYADEELSCPSGMTYNSSLGKCQSDPQCSAGSYNPATNRCEQTATGTPTCPSGMTYNSSLGKCTLTPTCANGSLNTSTDRCELAVTKTCPSGTTLNGNVCQVSPSCPNGGAYNTSTNRCEILATTVCPQGMTLSGNICVSYPSCSDGGTYDPSRGECSIPATSITCEPFCQLGQYVCPLPGICTYIRSSCPSNYSAVADRSCVSGYKCVPQPGCVTYSCPTGTTLSNSSCYFGAGPCPSGSSYNSTTKRCEVTASYTCPAGWTLSGTTCYQSSSCPSGTTLNTTTDKCEVAVTKTCPSGMTLSGDICYQSPTCAQGTYDTTQNMCLLASTTTYSCGTGWTLSGTICYTSPYCNTGSYSSTQDKCLLNPSTNYSCPSGWDLSGKLCTLNVNIDCSPGSYNTSTNRCEATLNIEIVEECPAGMTRSGNLCVSSADVEKNCPAGYTLLSGNICYKSESCSDMPTLEETTIYEATYSYYYDPPSFEPLENCVFGQFSCVDNRNTCITKTATQSCVKYDNICFRYERRGTCQEKIENIYTICNYKVTSEQVN